MDYSFILLAGGTGRRMNNAKPKQLLLLMGQPIISYSIRLAENLPEVKEIVTVVPKEFESDIVTACKDTPVSRRKMEFIFVVGGVTRQESVKNGLKAASCKNVILHEAARPLAPLSLFRALIEEKEPAVTTGINIPFTVLEQEGGFISRNLNRSQLVNIQLPQKFPREKLLKAHQEAGESGEKYTEDSALYFEHVGRVKVIPGAEQNIKITTWQDILVAEKILGDAYDE